MSQRKFRELEESTDDRDKLWNCQIIHYTRRDPETGIVAPNFYWVRSICPWDTSLSWNVWQPIHRYASQTNRWFPTMASMKSADGFVLLLFLNRPTYSNNDLAAEVALVPQLINSEDVPPKGRTATEEIVKKRALLDEWKKREDDIAKREEVEKESEDKRRAEHSWHPTSTVDGGNLTLDL